MTRDYYPRGRRDPGHLRNRLRTHYKEEEGKAKEESFKKPCVTALPSLYIILHIQRLPINIFCDLQFS